MRTREHVTLNRQINDAGYDTARMDAQTRQRIEEARSHPLVVQLAITAALEHFTAIMAQRY